MPRYFLNRLEIEGFRGINNQGEPLVLSFKTDRVNSVFAANALGKSSIFEALSFALRGVIPKLEKLPASEQPSSYYANRFHGSGVSTVLLSLRPDDGSADIDIAVTRGPSGKRTIMSPSGYADPEGLLQSLNTELALLDHSMFLEFISDAPLKRGRTFSGLLGLSALSEFRQALEVLSNRRNLNTDLELDSLERLRTREEQEAKETEKKVRAALGVFFAKEPDPVLNLTMIADSVLESLKGIPVVAAAITSSCLADVDFGAIRTAIKKAEGSEKRDRLSKVLQSIALLEGLCEAASEANQKAELRAALETRRAALATTRGALFHELYSIVQRLYTEEVWSDPLQCPACDSALSEALPERVAEKLQQYKDVDDWLRTIHDLWRTSAWPLRIKSLEEAESLCIPATSTGYSKWTAKFTGPQPTLEDLDSALSSLADLDTIRQKTLRELKNEKEALEKDLPPSLVALTQQVERAADLQDGIKALERSMQRQADLTTKITVRKQWATFIENASDEFAQAEVNLSTAKATALENDYRQMYEQVTSNPEVVPLLKKSETSEELHLQLAKFYGLTDLSAATLLPESYRNALAICIYLSAALRSTSPARFIVLDDVTSSFDAGHQWNLMELVRTKMAYPGNPSGPQIVILSHDGLLEKYFDSMAADAQWHHQRLNGLPPKGLVYPQTQSVDRLEQAARKYLAAGQIELAQPLVRQCLEQRLLQIIRKLDIPVPVDFSIRDDRKMVGNCLAAIARAIALHKKAGVLILQPQQVQDLENVHLPALVANWISHYSTATGTSISPYVLVSILDTINKISDSFIYPCHCSGGAQPRFYKNLAAKACSC